MVKYLDYGLLNDHTLHLLANTLNKVCFQGIFISIFRGVFFLKVYNPLLTYQNENGESDMVDGRRIPSSKISNRKESLPPAVETEETEEEKRDEKVGFLS
jgi:hypothetical protein